MMLSSQGENTKAFVKPRIREITMELLKIIRETENDDLTTVMQKIVCSYTEDLMPVAVQMCMELVQTFSQVLEGRYVLSRYFRTTRYLCIVVPTVCSGVVVLSKRNE